MPRQYKRNYELIIDKDGDIRKITELRITFEVTKSIRSYPNIAKISIYNAAPETKAFLDSKLTKVTLNAGYEDNLGLVFTGKIRNALQKKNGPDTITTVYSADGQKDWDQSTFNKTFSDTVSIKSIVKELAGTFIETAVGDLLGLETPADKLRGQTLSGSTKDILDTLGEDYGFQWSIQDGIFETVPLDEIIQPNDIIVLNSATGMIKSPAITEQGVEVKALLNTDLTPNRAFKIESVSQDVKLGSLNFRDVKKTSAEGKYKVFEVTHKGDLHDNEWSSMVKGVSVDGLS